MATTATLPRQSSATNRSMSPVARVKRRTSTSGSPTRRSARNLSSSGGRRPSTSGSPTRRSARNLSSNNVATRLPRKLNSTGTGARASRGLPKKSISTGSAFTANKSNVNNNSKKPSLLVDYSKKRADLRGNKPFSQSERSLKSLRRAVSLESNPNPFRSSAPPLSHGSFRRLKTQSEHSPSHNSSVDWTKLSNELEWGEEEKKPARQAPAPPSLRDASSCSDVLRNSFLAKPLGTSSSSFFNASATSTTAEVVQVPVEDDDDWGDTSRHSIILHSSRRESMNLKRRQSRSVSPVRPKITKVRSTNSLSPIQRPKSVSKRMVSGGPPPFNHMGLQEGSGSASFRSSSNSKGPSLKRSNTGPGPNRQGQPPPGLKRTYTNPNKPIRTKPSMARRTVSGGPPPFNHLGLQKGSKKPSEADIIAKIQKMDSSMESDGSMRFSEVFGVDGSKNGSAQGSSVRRSAQSPVQEEEEIEDPEPRRDRSPGRSRSKSPGGSRRSQSPTSGNQNIRTRTPSPLTRARAWASGSPSKKSAAEELQSNPSTDDETDVLIQKLSQDAAPPAMGRLYKSMSATMSAFKAAVKPPNNTKPKARHPSVSMDVPSPATNVNEPRGSLSFPRQKSQNSPNNPKNTIKGDKPKKKTLHQSLQHLGGTLGQMQPWDDDFSQSLSSMGTYWENMDDDSYAREQERRGTDSAVVHPQPQKRNSSLLSKEDDANAAEAEGEEPDLLPPPPPSPNTKRNAPGRFLKGSKQEDLYAPPSPSRKEKGSEDTPATFPRPLKGMPRRTKSMETLSSSTITSNRRRRSSQTRSSTSSSKGLPKRSLSDSRSQLNNSSSRLSSSRRSDTDEAAPDLHFSIRKLNSDRKLHSSVTSASENHKSDPNLMFGVDDDYLDEDEKRRKLRDEMVRSNSSFRRSKNSSSNHESPQQADKGTRSNPNSRSNTPSPNMNNSSRRTNLQKELSVAHMESEYDRFRKTIMLEHMKRTQSARSASPRRNAALLQRAESSPRNMGQKQVHRPVPVRASSSSSLQSNGPKPAFLSQLNSTRRTKPQQVIPPPQRGPKPPEIKKAASLSQMGAPRRAALAPTTWIRNKNPSSRSTPRGAGLGSKQGSGRLRGRMNRPPSTRGNNVRSSSPGPVITRSISPMRPKHGGRRGMNRSKSLDEDQWQERKGFRDSMLRQASFVTGSRIRRLNNNQGGGFSGDNSISNFNASFSHNPVSHNMSSSNLNYSFPNMNFKF